MKLVNCPVVLEYSGIVGQGVVCFFYCVCKLECYREYDAADDVHQYKSREYLRESYPGHQWYSDKNGEIEHLDEQNFEKEQTRLSPVQFADARPGLACHLQEVLGGYPVECHQAVNEQRMEELRAMCLFQGSVRRKA